MRAAPASFAKEKQCKKNSNAPVQRWTVSGAAIALRAMRTTHPSRIPNRHSACARKMLCLESLRREYAPGCWRPGYRLAAARNDAKCSTTPVYRTRGLGMAVGVTAGEEALAVYKERQIHDRRLMDRRFHARRLHDLPVEKDRRMSERRSQERRSGTDRRV